MQPLVDTFLSGLSGMQLLFLIGFGQMAGGVWHPA